MEKTQASSDLDVPVAIIVFNRLGQTQKLIEYLRTVRPKTLYIISDGPRNDKVGEAEIVDQVRACAQEIDWPCTVNEIYSDVNLGCKNRIQSGLDYVFEREEFAVILEDDCLPGADFFSFCQEMLLRYRKDGRVGMISGNNFHFDFFRTRTSYYFSNFPHIWGWATWARAWKLNEPNIDSWPEVRNSNLLKRTLRSQRLVDEWTSNFDGIHRVDTWDVQWVYSMWKNEMVSIAPNVNLVTNNGFGPDATHTKTPDFNSQMKLYPLGYPLRHPGKLRVHRLADWMEQRIKFLNLAIGFIKRGFRFANPAAR